MEETPKKEKDLTALLSYIGILVIIPLLVSKDDFAKFHIKQGLVLLIAEIATMFIMWIPIIGWFGGPILWIIWIVLSVLGILNVVSGKKTLLPIIGKFAEKFKF